MAKVKKSNSGSDGNTNGAVTKKGNSNWVKSMAKLPPGKRLGVKLDRFRTRLYGYMNSAKNWEHDSAKASVEAMAAAYDALEQASEHLTALGNFRPQGSHQPKIQLAVGTIVAVHEKARGQYKGLLTLETMETLTVADFRGKIVVCTTGDDQKLFLPRGHLQIVAVHKEEEVAPPEASA